MAYSKDLRERVIAFVRSGGSKAEAARRFKVCRNRVYTWLSLGDTLEPKKPGPKKNHKVDPIALMNSLKSNPDAQLKELGGIFGVHYSTIHYALKRMKYSRKKNLVV